MSSRDKAIKRCLVTGGAGFIGSHLAESLLAAGYQVRVFDNFSTGKPENLANCLDSIEIMQGDIRDFNAVQLACEGIDAILHQAAVASVYQSITDPLGTHEINVNGTINVLEAAQRKGIQKVLLASSAAVYGADLNLPKSESMVGKPASPYGLHKLMGEQYGHMYAMLYGLDVACFRYFNVYGPRQDPSSQYSGVISIFIDTILSGGTPTIYGDGMQSRDFVSVKDVCRANLLALENLNSQFEIFNVGCGQSHSLLELLEYLQAYCGREFEIKYQPERRGDLRHSLANITRISDILGYQPSTDFKQGLYELIEFASQERKNVQSTLKIRQSTQ